MELVYSICVSNLYTCRQPSVYSIDGGYVIHLLATFNYTQLSIAQLSCYTQLTYNNYFPDGCNQNQNRDCIQDSGINVIKQRRPERFTKLYSHAFKCIYAFEGSQQLSTPDDTHSDFIYNQVDMQAPKSEGLVPDLLGI